MDNILEFTSVRTPPDASKESGHKRGNDGKLSGISSGKDKEASLKTLQATTIEQPQHNMDVREQQDSIMRSHSRTLNLMIDYASAPNTTETHTDLFPRELILPSYYTMKKQAQKSPFGARDGFGSSGKHVNRRCCGRRRSTCILIILVVSFTLAAVAGIIAFTLRHNKPMRDLEQKAVKLWNQEKLLFGNSFKSSNVTVNDGDQMDKLSP